MAFTTRGRQPGSPHKEDRDCASKDALGVTPSAAHFQSGWHFPATPYSLSCRCVTILMFAQHWSDNSPETRPPRKEQCVVAATLSGCCGCLSVLFTLGGVLGTFRDRTSRATLSRAASADGGR